MYKKILSSFAVVIFSFVLTGFFSVNTVSAAPSCSATTTGNWSNPAIWSGCNGVGGVPASSDYVGINSGVTVTIGNGENFTIDTLVIMDAVSDSNGIIITGNGSLTMTNIVTGVSITQSSGSGNSTIDVGNGLLSTTNININGGAIGVSSITVNTGTITTSSYIGFGGLATNAQLISTGTSHINIGGTLYGGGTLTTNNTGTINFNGSMAQIMGAYTYNNVVISNTSGGVSLGGTSSVTGNLTINSGTLGTDTNNLSVTGTTTVENGATIQFTGPSTQTFDGDVILNSGSFWSEITEPTINLAGNLENNGTFTSDTGAHTLNGTDKIISGLSSVNFQNLTINGTITNNLEIEASSLSVTGSLINNSSITSANISGSGQLVNNAFGVINFTGDDASFFSIANLDLAAIGNTVNYSKNGDQTLRWATYYNLGLLISGSKTNNLMSLSHVTNNLIIDGPVVFYPNNSMEIKGLNYDRTQQPAGRYGPMSSGYDYRVSFLDGSGHITVTNVANAPGTPTAAAGPTINGTEETAGFDVVVPLGTSGAIVGDSVSLHIDGSQIYSIPGSVGTIAYTQTNPGELQDATSGGTYIGGSSCTLVVGVYSLADGPHGYDQFIYGLMGSGCSGANLSPTEITPGHTQSLINGATITFAHGTGHAAIVLSGGGSPVSSYWTMAVNPGVLNVNYIHELSTEDISTGSYTFNITHGTLGDDGVKTITAKIVRVNTAGDASDPLLLTLDTYVAPPTPDPTPTQQTTVLVIPVAPPTQGPSGGSNGGSNGGNNDGGSTPGCAPGNLFSTTTGQRCSSQSNQQSIFLFTRSLRFGSYGADVKKLQEFLNSHGSPVATSGPGSLGYEMKVFGSKTTTALAKYQAANNITPAAGVLGFKTASFINEILLAGK